jgi:lipid-binding SYLF domain-containing protein
VYHELLATPDCGVPETLLKGCRCVAVVPNVLKGAFVYGGRYGTGVMSCRDGTASVAAGPFGRSGEASTDLKLNAEIYTYAKSKGLLAGLPLEGARMAADQKSNAQYYGQPVSVNQLLFEHKAPRVPDEAETFLKALP